MRALADPGPANPANPADPGRRIWAVSGLLTAAAVVIGTALVLAPAPDSPQNATAQPRSAQPLGAQPQASQAQATQPQVAQAQTIVTQTIAMPQPVTGLTVQSYGGPVQVTSGPPGGIQVTEVISYQGTPPSVTRSVRGSQVLLADPACSNSGPAADACRISFILAVLPGLRVAVITDGGPARLTFAEPPRSVSVSTGGGPATVSVPGGPYALTADSGGGPEIIAVATDPAAGRTITVSTAGGPLQIGP